MRRLILTPCCSLCVLALLFAYGADSVAQEPEAPAAEATPAEHHDAAAGHGYGDLGHGNAGRQLEDASEFKTDLAIYTFVVFLLLLAILGWFAWPPIVRALEERERTIAENIAAAEARHEDAKRLLAEHQAKLAAAAGEVRELLEEARRDAEHTRKAIADKGRQEAQDELNRAVREIGRAKDAAVQELAVASANVAIDLARKVVREQMTAEQQNEIVREALGKLAAASPSKN
jgi:F-type H+-transporting ATPase subunit b